MNTWSIVENHLLENLTPPTEEKTCPYCGIVFTARQQVREKKEYVDDRGKRSKVYFVEYPAFCSKLCRRLMREELEDGK